MKASDQLYKRIRDAEAFRSIAYLDQAGVWTIGFGTTKDVTPGMRCTREQAEMWLHRDIEAAENIVRRAITRPLTQNQFDACVMFAYNTGTMGVKLRKELNAGNFSEAVRAMAEWKYYTDKKTGKKKVSNGLVARRTEEIELFNA